MSPLVAVFPPFVCRVALRYFRSIPACDVRLGRITALVGPNGAGKSNFVDALRFVRDSLRHTLEFAMQDRGGIDAVRFKSSGHPTHFGIRLDLDFPDGHSGWYAFQIAAQKNGGFVVQKEQCRVRTPEGGVAHFQAEGGKLKSASCDVLAVVEPDRLFLTTISAISDFRPLYDGLTNMGLYNLNPARIRQLQDPDPGQVLEGDGRNLASVLRELGRSDPQAKERIDAYLRTIVPDVESAEYAKIGPKVTLEFRQDVGQTHPWRFSAQSMSDGTLRALGVLAAAFQGRVNGHRRVNLIGIEEPEVALHPGAAEALAEALLAASVGVQVLLTTHSPDLLEHKGFQPDQILAVVNRKGRTSIAPIDEASREALRKGLYSVGELLRIGQLEPDEAQLFEEGGAQLDLFDTRPV